MKNVKDLNFTDPAVDPSLGTRRTEVMETLAAAKEPLTASQVAERTGLHLNTARFHLDGLVNDGLATRTVEGRATPGRPRILYSDRVGAGGPRSFGLLAEMLTGLVSSLDGAGEAATKVGRSWGLRLVEEDASPEPPTADEALMRLNRVLDAIGFQPEISTRSDGKVELHLHHCPFQEVAVRHSEVVCALHLGLMQGTLSGLAAPLAADSVQPFVSSNLCTATLRVFSAGAA